MKSIARQLLLFFLTISFGIQAGAQTTSGGYVYGNEWYIPTQTYFKLKVHFDGIYKVSATQLSASGVDLSGVDPDNIHVYYRGNEIPVYIEKASGIFSYMEFYGIRNDGREDAALYKSSINHLADPTLQPNIYRSLFSDTSAYFVTWNNDPGLRMNLFTENNYADYPAQASFRFVSLISLPANLNSNNYTSAGNAFDDPLFTINSNYVTGEGYCDNGISAGQERNYNIPTPRHAGGDSEIFARVVGATNTVHNLQLLLNNVPIYTDLDTGIFIKTHIDTVSTPLTTTSQLKLKSLSLSGTSDLNNPCWVAISYNREFNLDNGNTMTISDYQHDSITYIVFSNVTSSTKAFLYDVTDGTRIPAKIIASKTMQFLIPGSANKRKLIFIAENAFNTPIISPATSLNHIGDPGSYDMVLISNKRLKQSAQSYRTYRDTNTVNPLRTLIVYIDEIYDEFGYGSATPMAIKRFCKYALDEFIDPPEYFFLWGKTKKFIRNEVDNLVPTFGVPACDWDYVSDFDYTVLEVRPKARIGRINIYNDQQGFNYIEKLIEYEHTEHAPWMKTNIFIGGGGNSTEQSQIYNSMTGLWKPVYEAGPNGGKINYWQRRNTLLETNTNTNITTAISSGSGIIHFFGHSAANIFDVDIQDADQYTNYGRYPLMIAMGCYGGDFTGNGSFGEKFVLEKGRGSIGYLANSTAGLAMSLIEYGTNFYNNAFRDEYGNSLGEVLMQTGIDLMTEPGGNHTNSIIRMNQFRQMNLQGDPSIHLQLAAKPDLEILPSEVSFFPENPTTADETFELLIHASNFGKVQPDSFQLRVTQRLPGGTTIIHPEKKYAPVYYKDTLRFKIENTLGAISAGINEFEIFIDAGDTLDEYNESNNIAIVRKLILSDAPALIYPPDFAIIPTDTISIIISRFQIYPGASVDYIIEIDTAFDFNSSFKVSSGVLRGKSAYLEWKVPFKLETDKVYFMRARLANVLPAVWSSASFRHIPGKSGWSQAVPSQMLKNPGTNVSIDEINQKWSFGNWVQTLHAYVKNREPQFFLGPFRSSSFPAFADGIVYTAISQKTLSPSVSGSPQGNWRYAIMPQSQADLVNTISSMTNGDYLLICSNFNANMNLWDNNTLKALELIGCNYDILRAVPNNNPFVIFGRKGYPGSAYVIIHPNATSEDGFAQYDLELNLTAKLSEGEVWSTGVGPTISWQGLEWDWKTLDQFPIETNSVSVYGIKKDHTQDLLLSNLDIGTTSLSGIDASVYPRLQLISSFKDDINFTPPQISEWNVYYPYTAEIAVDPEEYFALNADSVNEGEQVTVSLSGRNLSLIDMDSILVKFTAVKADNSTLVLGYQRYAPMPSKTNQVFTYNINTGSQNLTGRNRLIIELNPDDDQPEEYRFNNIYETTFFVKSDGRNPWMDVIVDGKHLMEGDIVSPEPEIVIQVADENVYLPLTVSDSTYKIWFGPGRAKENQVPILIAGNPRIEATAGTITNNKTNVVFRPGALADGEYTLQVQTFDVSGNPSGESDYVIHFEVINENNITKVLPYPNPFSTSARFAYLLTGREFPYRFEIDIYTITGKMVKHIDLLDTEVLHFGYNITDFSWDGRDEFGDQLANGVYIYKVLAKFKDRTVNIESSGDDKYFKNNFGKIYLMR